MVTGLLLVELTLVKCHQRLVVHPGANVQPCLAWRFQNKCWWWWLIFLHNWIWQSQNIMLDVRWLGRCFLWVGCKWWSEWLSGRNGGEMCREMEPIVMISNMWPFRWVGSLTSWIQVVIAELRHSRGGEGSTQAWRSVTGGVLWNVTSLVTDIIFTIFTI